MNFTFQWSNKKEGNYAIRKRDAKGQEAGREIELNLNQKSDTHFFLLVDKPNEYDTMRNIRKINEILKTINYEYVFKGTEKKSNNKYLTKDDIKNVLENIEEYKNKTKRIETANSKIIDREKEKELTTLLKKNGNPIGDIIGYKEYEKALKFLIKNIEKEKEIKVLKKDAGIQIKFHNKAIQGIKENLTKQETKAKEEREKIEFLVFNLLYEESKTIYDAFKERKKYKMFLAKLYELAKAKARKQKLKTDRERKNAESGKPKGKVGRPRKNKA